MRIYLDLETYRQKKKAFTNEKIIAIGIIEDWTRYIPESSEIWDNMKVNILYFTEWKLEDESQVVAEFYNYLRKLIDEWKSNKINFIGIVGFNMLRYDIPLLIQKGVECGVDSLPKLNALWHNIFTIDYLQTILPFNNMKFSRLKLEYIAKKAKEKGINVPEPYYSGEKVKKWYEKKMFDEIIKHLETDLKILRIIDLNYRQIYQDLF